MNSPSFPASTPRRVLLQFLIDETLAAAPTTVKAMSTLRRFEEGGDPGGQDYRAITHELEGKIVKLLEHLKKITGAREESRNISPKGGTMRHRFLSTLPALVIGLAALSAPVLAQDQNATGDKPNILLIVSDDTGWGDLGPYLGGEARGMQSPNIDQLANDGMFFTNFYGQPSCTPGRAAIQTGRIPNRSGMTTVAFQGQGGGLPEAEWTLASVLKTTGYKTYFTGKWHLGEADYALPNAQGYDVMKYTFLYHLNAYTYPDAQWFPEMDPELRELFTRVTTGSLSGNAGEKAKEDFKVNGEYVDTPDKGVVGIPFLDGYVEKAAYEFLEDAAKHKDTPFFINVNFMKNHQPNLPHPDFINKSISKSKYADSVVELDTRIGNVLKKLDELGLAEEHAGCLHGRQWRLAGCLSGCGLYAVPGHQGHYSRRW